MARDLEGVVDALKRVTDKLRGENDRLRRVAGEGGGRAEAERSAREAKKKAVLIAGFRPSPGPLADRGVV